MVNIIKRVAESDGKSREEIKRTIAMSITKVLFRGLILVSAFTKTTYSNSIFYAAIESKPWYFGINSELYSLYAKRALNNNQTFLVIKPYLEYQRSSYLVSSNLRIETDDAFMMTFGAEVGPTIYFGARFSAAYNLRVSFTLLKIAQVSFGCRTYKFTGEPYLLGDFAFGLHYPLFGKNQFGSSKDDKYDKK